MSKYSDKWLSEKNKKTFNSLMSVVDDNYAVEIKSSDNNGLILKVLGDHGEEFHLCICVKSGDLCVKKDAEQPIIVKNNNIGAIIDYLNDSKDINDDDIDEYEPLWEKKEKSETSKRNVFIFKEFDNQLYKIIKNNDDIIALKNKIISCLLTIEDDDLQNWLYDSKHRVIVHTSSHRLVRARTPRGPNISKINRFFLCEGREIKNERFSQINDKDIVLLSYMGEDLHPSNEYKAYAELIWEELSNASAQDVNRVDSFTVKSSPEMGIVQKAYLPEEGNEIHYVPLLDKDQNRILEEDLKLKPPCVIYGSAGTGKTLLSEQLYEDLRKEHPDYKILYLTYMPRLKNQVYNELKMRNLHSIKAKHLYELLNDNLKGNSVIQTFDDFKKWFTEYCKTGFNVSVIDKNTEKAISIIYIFFRTYSFTDDIKNTDYFMKAVSGECALQYEQKEKIYVVCKAYQTYIEKNRLYTDNNAAQYIISHARPQYDAIIVDEIQDLTQLQVKCIIHLLKPEHKYNFFAFGDDNQSINPTLMRMSQAKSLVYTELGKVNNEIALSGSYRSTSYLIHYINYINSVRQKTIGKDSSYNDLKQWSNIKNPLGNQSDKPAVITDSKIIDMGLRDNALFVNNDIMVISPDGETAENLRKKYPHLSVGDFSTNILPIEETKGGEWDQVIHYNFFSSSEPIWRDFSDRFKDNNSGSLKSTIHRMYFNRFYVGLTRAAKKIIIFESEPLTPVVKEIFLPKILEIENGTQHKFCLSFVNDYDEFRSIFKNDFTHDIWIGKAKKMFQEKDYEMAVDYVSKAIRAARAAGVEDIAINYEIIKEQYQLTETVNGKNRISEEDAPIYIEQAFSLNMIDIVKDIYQKSGKNDRLAWMMENNPEKIIENHNKNLCSYYSGEDEYYMLKAVKAYHKIINSK